MQRRIGPPSNQGTDINPFYSSLHTLRFFFGSLHGNRLLTTRQALVYPFTSGSWRMNINPLYWATIESNRTYAVLIEFRNPTISTNPFTNSGLSEISPRFACLSSVVWHTGSCIHKTISYKRRFFWRVIGRPSLLDILR